MAEIAQLLIDAYGAGQMARAREFALAKQEKDQQREDQLYSARAEYAQGNPDPLMAIAPSEVYKAQTDAANRQKAIAEANFALFEKNRQMQLVKTQRAGAVLDYALKDPAGWPKYRQALANLGGGEESLPEEITPELLIEMREHNAQLIDMLSDQPKINDVQQKAAIKLQLNTPYQIASALRDGSLNKMAVQVLTEEEKGQDEASKRTIYGKKVRPGQTGWEEAYNQTLREMQAEELAKRRASNQGGLSPAGYGAWSSTGAGGTEFLATLPPERQTIVKAIVEGRYEMPKGTALRSPAGQQIMSDVARYAPDFDASQWKVRNDVRADFTKGKTAQNITALNTMIQHLGEMADASKKLQNSNIKLWNKVANYAAENAGDPRITTFKTAAHAVADEAGKLFRGTGGTSDAETAAMHSVLDENGSPAQQMAAAQTLIHLASGRLDAIKDQWNNAFRGAAEFEFITPKSRRVLQEKLGVELEGVEQPAAAGAPQASQAPGARSAAGSTTQAAAGQKPPEAMSEAEILAELEQLEGGR